LNRIGVDRIGVGSTEQLGVDLDVVGSALAWLDNRQFTIADALEYTTVLGSGI
jgi:hypothetical protein